MFVFCVARLFTGLRLRFDDTNIFDSKVQFFECECQWLCDFLQCERIHNFISGWPAGRQAQTDGRTDKRDEDNSHFTQFYKRS